MSYNERPRTTLTICPRCGQSYEDSPADKPGRECPVCFSDSLGPAPDATPVSKIVPTAVNLLPTAGWFPVGTSDGYLYRKVLSEGGEPHVSLSIRDLRVTLSSEIKITIDGKTPGTPVSVSRDANITIIGWLRWLADKLEVENGPEQTTIAI